MAVNLLMLTHFFRFEMVDPNYRLRINPFPTLAPNRKLKVTIAEKRRDLRGPLRAPTASEPWGTCPVTGATAS